MCPSRLLSTDNFQYNASLYDGRPCAQHVCVGGSTLHTKTVWSSACEAATWRVIFGLPILRKSCKKYSLLICVS